MDEHTENLLTWKPYVWRGALGGAIGAVVVVLVYSAYSWFSVDAHIRGYLVKQFLLAGVVEILAAVIIGVVVGFFIFAVTRRLVKQPGVALRVFVGTFPIVAVLLIMYLTQSGQFRPIFDLGYASAVGGLAGLMAHSNAAKSITAKSA